MLCLWSITALIKSILQCHIVTRFLTLLSLLKTAGSLWKHWLKWMTKYRSHWSVLNPGLIRSGRSVATPHWFTAKLQVHILQCADWCQVSPQQFDVIGKAGLPRYCKNNKELSFFKAITTARIWVSAIAALNYNIQIIPIHLYYDTTLSPEE